MSEDIVRLLRVETNRLCSAAADEIERLRAEGQRELANCVAGWRKRNEWLMRQNDEAAAFLDGLADKLDGGGFAKDVADCRAMAAKLRGRGD